MFVGDGVAVAICRIARDGGDDAGIALRNRDLLDGVGDVRASILRIQPGPALRPMVVAVQSDRFARLLAVSIELHLNALRSNAILVFAILPFLGHRHAGLAGSVAVFKLKYVFISIECSPSSFTICTDINIINGC